MLSELIRRLLAAFGVAFRTIRSLFVRQIQTGAARIKNAANLNRQAAKAAPALLKKVADIGQKPSKREDYIETKQMFISKSFLTTLILAVIILAALGYLVAWPWLLSHFFTAKFWCEDPKIERYTGKVILYYEKGKDTVQFKGRLEDGVIQGKGEYYDENGLLVYSGNYIDGIYSGQGKLYNAGTLSYEGTFLEGLFDGEGTLYEPTGEPLYEGGFSAGLRSGEGTAYLDGERLYKGDFVGGLYNGDGILYNPDGGIRYRGSFLDGHYSGSGVLTLDSGATVQAEFEQGDVIGDARCFLDGKLYYEGSLRQLVPDGMGTLYNASGKALYSGPMKYGVIDGGALLETPAAELRELLEDTTEKSYDQGFAIACEALGFAAFCSYAQEDAGPMVYRVYLYVPKGNRSLGSLMWDSPEAFENLARQEETPPERAEGGTAEPESPLDFLVQLGKESHCQPYRYDGYTLNLWSRRSEETPRLLEWRLGEGLPEVAPEDSEASEPAGQMDALIARLGLVSDRLASGSGGQVGGQGGQGGSPSKNPKNGAALLKAVKDVDHVYPVLTAALQYLELKEQRTAALENLALYQEMAEAEKARIDAGTGNAGQLSQLEDEMAQADVQIEKYTAQMRREARTIESAAGLQVDDYDLSDLLLLFNVNDLDIDALGEAVIAAAEEAARKQAEEEAAQKETGKEAAQEAETAKGDAENTSEGQDGESSGGTQGSESASGPQGTENAEEAQSKDEENAEPVVPEIDRQALLRALEDNILDLELAYQDVQLAHRSYESALISLEDLKDQHMVGEVDKASVQRAQITANTRRGLLYSAMAAFARQAAVLDESTGGALAKQQGWLTDVLAN